MTSSALGDVYAGVVLGLRVLDEGCLRKPGADPVLRLVFKWSGAMWGQENAV